VGEKKLKNIEENERMALEHFRLKLFPPGERVLQDARLRVPHRRQSAGRSGDCRMSRCSRYQAGRIG
jgi:hypothetical protein